MVIFEDSMNNRKDQIQWVSLWDMLNIESENLKENTVQTIVKTTPFGHCSI